MSKGLDSDDDEGMDFDTNSGKKGPTINVKKSKW
jgi:hypothetical protein